MDTSNDDNDRHVIQLKTCPRCKTPIRTSLRYGNVIKQQLHDIEKVKEKLLGNKSELFEKTSNLYSRASELSTLLMFDVLERYGRIQAFLKKRKSSIFAIKSETRAAIIENQLTLIMRLYAIEKKKDSVLTTVSPEVSSENNLQRKFVIFTHHGI